jgi:hypothetical protein
MSGQVGFEQFLELQSDVLTIGGAILVSQNQALCIL